jgi:hypothetical protein
MNHEIPNAKYHQYLYKGYVSPGEKLKVFSLYTEHSWFILATSVGT